MVLGKRRRMTAEEESGSESDGGPQAVFQRHFEARFTPLDGPSKPKARAGKAAREADDDDASEWSGISESDSESNSPEPEVRKPKDAPVADVEVVRYTSSEETRATMSREERKAFMTSKPPMHSADSQKPKSRSRDTGKAPNTSDEADNLKNDLALQRLLQESHLLDMTSSLSPSGINRHRAIDLRMQTVGAKSSIFKQRKMPMAFRQGILAKAKLGEERRRREAREGGIILEKETRTNPVSSKKREKGIGAPSVGRFKGGTLTLSKHDLASIRGPKRSRRR